MGGELLDNKGTYEGDDGFKPQHDRDICQSEAEVSEKPTQTITGVLSQTMDHCFPHFNEWLKEFTDARLQERIVYKRETILWAALVTMLTKRGSRKKIKDHMRTECFSENLKEFSGQDDIERVPHGDTVEYLFTRMKPEEFEFLKMKMMQRLFRMRIFEPHRLMGRYHTIAIDGVHIHTFGYRHCERCMVSKDVSGNRVWVHWKLQASLVTPDGFCMPMASEWIENERGRYDKQDCELKACYRLLKKLRRLYPRLPICVLLDSLYTRRSVFNTLKKLRMEWIIVFKKGAMPEVYEWSMSRKERLASGNIIIRRRERYIKVRNRRSHAQRLARTKTKTQNRKVIRESVYTWMSDIRHWDGKRSFNILTCKETEDNKKKCDYVWIVSNGLKLCKDNAVELAKRGRCRWVIENQGINMQKNGGYNLKHLYSRDTAGMKIWYAILDIACIINQLIERGSLIVKKVFGSIRNISEKMFQNFCYLIFKKPSIRPRIQIRFKYHDTS